jgi:tRNA (mo5U34)-methyltransferase
MDLDGVPTAPDHFLGDYPRSKFARFEAVLPADLTGKTVLDIGCNAGFYSIEMKRRGAKRVLGIDSDDRYLAQARLACDALGQDGIEFRNLSIYDVARSASGSISSSSWASSIISGTLCSRST